MEPRMLSGLLDDGETFTVEVDGRDVKILIGDKTIQVELDAEDRRVRIYCPGTFNLYPDHGMATVRGVL